MVPRKAVFWGVREEQLRQEEKPVISTHFNLTTGKGSYKRGYLLQTGRGRQLFWACGTRLCFYRKEIFIYARHQKIEERGELLELII